MIYGQTCWLSLGLAAQLMWEFVVTPKYVTAVLNLLHAASESENSWVKSYSSRVAFEIAPAELQIPVVRSRSIFIAVYCTLHNTCFCRGPCSIAWVRSQRCNIELLEIMCHFWSGLGSDPVDWSNIDSIWSEMSRRRNRLSCFAGYIKMWARVCFYLEVVLGKGIHF